MDPEGVKARRKGREALINAGMSMLGICSMGPSEQVRTEEDRPSRPFLLLLGPFDWDLNSIIALSCARAYKEERLDDEGEMLGMTP